MNPIKKIQVTENNVGERLDVALAQHFAGEFSRSQIKHWIEKGKVLIDGKLAKANTLLKINDQIVCETQLKKEIHLEGEDIPLDIIYDDEDLLVVNKPPGLVVHPGSGNPNHTLANALIHHTKSKLSKGSAEVRPGIVHRLDKETSGLLVVAKNDWTHERLAQQFKKHSVGRTYWVVVHGVVQHDEIKCEEPLGKSPVDRRKVIVDPANGRDAVSFFYTKERFNNATLLEARLQTGRTHQIRVHLKFLGYPVIGDKDYGLVSKHIKRQALHAKTLKFKHPRTQKEMSFDSKLPEDFSKLIALLQKSSG